MAFSKIWTIWSEATAQSATTIQNRTPWGYSLEHETPLQPR